MKRKKNYNQMHFTPACFIFSSLTARSKNISFVYFWITYFYCRCVLMLLRTDCIQLNWNLLFLVSTLSFLINNTMTNGVLFQHLAKQITSFVFWFCCYVFVLFAMILGWLVYGLSFSPSLSLRLQNSTVWNLITMT